MVAAVEMAAGGTAVTMAAEVGVEEVTTATTAHVWVVVRPYLLLPPIPIVVLKGGMERTTTAHAMACEGSRVRGFGVRGFEGSIPGPHPEGIISHRGLVRPLSLRQIGASDGWWTLGAHQLTRWD